MKLIDLSPATLSRRLAHRQNARLNQPTPARYTFLGTRCESEIERIFWKVGYPELSRLVQFTPQVTAPLYCLDFALVRFRGSLIWNDTPGCVADVVRLIRAVRE